MCYRSILGVDLGVVRLNVGGRVEGSMIEEIGTRKSVTLAVTAVRKGGRTSRWEVGETGLVGSGWMMS